jgi:uncharacterized membrane protein YciS (DUF1049 family)
LLDAQGGKDRSVFFSISVARRYFWLSVFAAVVLFVYYRHYAANLIGPPSGRTPQGMALGILGFGAMIGALLYSARRRLLARAMGRIHINSEARKELKEREKKAYEELQALQRSVIGNPNGSPKVIRGQAKAILKKHGVTRYIQCHLIGGRGQPLRLDVARREWAGRLEIWYYWHLMLGVLSVGLILTHAGFRFGNLIATLAFLFLVGVVVTGIIGYFIYRIVPLALTQVEERVQKTPEEIRAELQEVETRLSAIVQGKSDVFREIYQREIAIPHVRLKPSLRWLWGPAEMTRDTTRPDRFRMSVEDIPSPEQETFREMARLLFQREKLVVSLYPQLRYDYLLKMWLTLHIPLTAGLMIFSLIHILSIWYY